MTRIVFFSRVVQIIHRTRRVWVSGLDENAKFRQEDEGYYMLLDGSYEALHVGFDMPEFRVGDKIKVTMEKVNGK